LYRRARGLTVVLTPVSLRGVWHLTSSEELCDAERSLPFVALSHLRLGAVRPRPRRSTSATGRWACSLRRATRPTGDAHRCPRAAAAEPGNAYLPGLDAQPTGAALHEPGPQPCLRLQPCRGAASVPRSGAPRPEP